ncbi:MAG: DUF2889 domain-containing protein [Streptosporangiales bacterium]|nr:DUF2889 domain-containing protein [Streptosporangiales bacterium]
MASEMTGAAPGRIADPVRGFPGRRPGSLRRVSSLAVSAPDGWDAGTVVEAAAGESGTGDDGQAISRGRAGLRARLGPDWHIAELEGDLPGPGIAARLTGLPVNRGFRKALAAAAEEGLAPDSLIAALLDDLPTVQLVSGYARLLEGAPPPAAAKNPVEPPADSRPLGPVLNICRGWAPGGTAHHLMLAGQPPVTEIPAAPAFGDLVADPGDFIGEPELRPHSMRRRRILEVTPAGGRAEIWEYFRDSHVDGDGRERSLHEYVVTAVVGTGDLTVREIAVEPRSLPFPECPLASPGARELIGTPLPDIDAEVRSRLAGIAGCTHLNDVLRFLRFAQPLIS